MTMYARPWLHIHEPSRNSAGWLTKESIKLAVSIFERPIVYHPLTGLYNINKQVLGRVPAVAIVGESNVGKSTLLNQLVFGRQPQHRFKLSSTEALYSPVSDKPGRTRHVFRFDFGDRLRICDLPGYGIAYAPKEVTDSWNELIDKFLEVADLKRVIVLIDAMKGIEDLDNVVIKMLEDRGKIVQVVLTKIDKVSQRRLSDIMIQTVDILQGHNKATMFPYLNAISGLNNLGITELKCSLASAANR